MVAGLLWSMGCWIGHTRYGDQYNPRGYFENTGLKWMLKQTYGFDLLGPFPEIKSGWREAVKTELLDQDYRGEPWLFKTGVHYAGIWGEFDPIVVKVMRNRENILESYARYGGIWKSFGPDGATRIVDRGLERLRDLPGIEIDTDQLTAGDTSGIRAVCKKVFLPYRETDFIIPGAFHAG